jgi:hypothetical protein
MSSFEIGCWVSFVVLVVFLGALIQPVMIH